MKKTLTSAAVLSVFALPAFAGNVENPMYLPAAGEAFSKTTVGVMYKEADDSDAHKAKQHDGAKEFPIWRLREDVGYGITDRLALHLSVGYTHDGDIDRQGMHMGRLGGTYRFYQDESGFMWDIYGDLHLGGFSDMTGEYTDRGFNYDNYSNGRWGFHVGTKFGKTWSKLTTSAYFEVLHTFGSDNNEIDIANAHIPGMPAIPQTLLTAAGLPSEISVDLESTTEFNAGLNAFYQLDDRWSFGAGFRYNHHADNGVKGLATSLEPIADPVKSATRDAIVAGLEEKLADMNDGFEEYVVSLSVANQLTDMTQVVLYGEYTFDDAHQNSQNGTDVKAEIGARVNIQF